MAKFTDINRKHYRFPAFKDDEGVKLQKENKRNLFAKDRSWLLTDEGKYPQVSQKLTKEQHGTLFSESPQREERTIRRSRKTTAEKQGHTKEQEAELKKHRENLPDYAHRIMPVTDKVGRTSLFGKEYKRSTYKVKTRTDRQTEANSLKRAYSGRSYFVPKYIPASILPDEEKKNTAEINDQELMKAMDKPKDSYLMFDTEPSAYQEKKEGDPSVQKFQTPEEVVEESVAPLVVEPEPMVSREEFRKMDDEKKNRVLERSLQGLIEEEQAQLDDNGYFNHE